MGSRRAVRGAGSAVSAPLARRGRPSGLGQPLGDAVVAANAVEQHFTAFSESVGELLAMVEVALRAVEGGSAAPSAQLRLQSAPGPLAGP